MFRRAWVLVLFVVSVSRADERAPTSREHCETYSGITDTNVVFNLQNMSQDKRISCYVMCLGYYDRKVTKEGRLLLDKPFAGKTFLLAKHSMISALVREALNQCANETGRDFCETAHNTAICLNKNPMFSMYEEGIDVSEISKSVTNMISSFLARERLRKRQN